MLQKLSLNDLTCVSGGQIYAFFDKEKEIYHYLVPSTAGYATYHNKTEALANLLPLAKKALYLAGPLMMLRILPKQIALFTGS